MKADSAVGNAMTSEYYPRIVRLKDARGPSTTFSERASTGVVLLGQVKKTRDTRHRQQCE